jgi:hypothetical protein
VIKVSTYYSLTCDVCFRELRGGPDLDSLIAGMGQNQRYEPERRGYVFECNDCKARRHLADEARMMRATAPSTGGVS